MTDIEGDDPDFEAWWNGPNGPQHHAASDKAREIIRYFAKQAYHAGRTSRIGRQIKKREAFSL